MNFINEGLSKFYYFIQGGIQHLIPNPNISYGIAIIVFTIIIRLILLPLNMKQTRSQVKMQEIQPELKKLQEKYKSDPQKAQQETMKLYKEKGVNPMGGCLPLIIQLPILWALFYVFRNIHPVDAATGQAIKVSFLWIKDLFGTDQLYILPILSGATTYLSSLMMTPATDSAQAKQTSTMNIGMAIFMVFMSWRFTAALVLYWVVNNLIQIGQTALMKKMDAAKANANA
ncbi:membrane protein insertase YidC [Candidatus Clostridium stratigraminis]|uniref:Membrane protein insertase YidC n=1 Tax=Candidatus Clostridium stratigraminis TaxID=3381661 RepID=A0ABW8T8P3_9CLOT